MADSVLTDSNVNTPIVDNMESWNTIGWLLNSAKDGMFLLTASPRMQREVLSHYTYASLKVYDCAGWKKGFELAKVKELLESAPGVQAHFFLEFQDVLSGPSGKDWDTNIYRFNRARDVFYGEELRPLWNNLVFCVTPDTERRLMRDAPDIEDYFRQISFEDQLPQEGGKKAPIRMNDRSVGVEVELDWTLTQEELLAQANDLMEQGEELRKALRYRDALTVFDNARQIRKKFLTAEHPDTASVYFWIAYTHIETANYLTALEYEKRALKIREKVLGLESPDTATTYNDIGMIYLYTGEYTTALEWSQKALEIREKVLGREHSSTAITYGNIGSVYAELGKYQKALNFYQKALDIWKTTLEDNHHNIAKVYANMAGVYANLGFLPLAIEYAQKSLEIMEKMLGPDHPDTAEVYFGLGNLYKFMGKNALAVMYMEKAKKNPVLWKRVYSQLQYHAKNHRKKRKK